MPTARTDFFRRSMRARIAECHRASSLWALAAAWLLVAEDPALPAEVCPPEPAAFWAALAFEATEGLGFGCGLSFTSGFGVGSGFGLGVGSGLGSGFGGVGGGGVVGTENASFKTGVSNWSAGVSRMGASGVVASGTIEGVGGVMGAGGVSSAISNSSSGGVSQSSTMDSIDSVAAASGITAVPPSPALLLPASGGAMPTINICAPTAKATNPAPSTIRLISHL